MQSYAADRLKRIGLMFDANTKFNKIKQLFVKKKKKLILLAEQKIAENISDCLSYGEFKGALNHYSLW